MKGSQQAKLKGPDRVDLIWRRLERHSRKVENRRISSLFDDDAGRAERFAAEHDGLYFDYSKTNIDERTLDWLIELATVARVPRQRDRIFEGHCHNQTEQRAVRHTFLRDHAVLSSENEVGDVRHRVGQQLGRALNFAAKVRSGDFASSSGREFSDVVNIGIGGSDLGPAMCTAAVASGTQNPRVHFMSNVDGAHVADVLRPLNPERTLVIVCSKTFSTRETMTNAATARAWLNATVGESASASHMVAVSNSIGRTSEFGVPASQTFAFDEAIGGRFSVWGPVGLSFMIAAGRRK
ncbi:MAG: glucose-6-phosphate isomerase, partial [Rhodobacteraceae bacterium]|nr:glucose-6-phosphate isomerase [Paracoccaceae bacterium]